MRAVFTLCSNNYLAQAKTLAESFLSKNNGCTFIIGLVDRYNPAIDYNNFTGVQIISCEELNVPEFSGMMRRYTIIEFNTAVKPFYIEYLFRHGYDKIVYLDPDIEVYHSLDSLFETMNEYDILLTPHVTISQPSRSEKWYQMAHLTGIYNLGFLAIAKSDNTLKLLNWWQEKLVNYCITDTDNGYFVDQIWANHFPVLFEKVKVLMDPGMNMSYWNMDHRSVTKENDIFLVNGSPLKFYHFSGFKMNHAERISAKADYTFEERPDLAPLYAGYHAKVMGNQYARYSKILPTLNGLNTYGAYKYFGKRVRAHGIRWYKSFIRFVFGV